MMTTVAIIQARMGSSRLPGKVLADIDGKPMLQRVIERAQGAKRLDRVIVATSTAATDDPVATLCTAMGIACERGSEHDVLDRYYQAAKAQCADVVVRLTADCPLLEAAVIDGTIAVFAAGAWDYVSNTWPTATYPDGLDTEVMRFDALATAWQEARLSSEREHVTPYLYNHPERFRLQGAPSPVDLSAWRLTVDEAADLALVRALYAHLPTNGFALSDILTVLKGRPDLQQLNANIERNAGYALSRRLDHPSEA